MQGRGLLKLTKLALRESTGISLVSVPDFASDLVHVLFGPLSYNNPLHQNYLEEKCREVFSSASIRELADLGPLVCHLQGSLAPPSSCPLSAWVLGTQDELWVSCYDFFPQVKDLPWVPTQKSCDWHMPLPLNDKIVFGQIKNRVRSVPLSLTPDLVMLVYKCLKFSKILFRLLSK